MAGVQNKLRQYVYYLQLQTLFPDFEMAGCRFRLLPWLSGLSVRQQHRGTEIYPFAPVSKNSWLIQSKHVTLNTIVSLSTRVDHRETDRTSATNDAPRVPAATKLRVLRRSTTPHNTSSYSGKSLLLRVIGRLDVVSFPDGSRASGGPTNSATGPISTRAL